jgi:predicted ATPase
MRQGIAAHQATGTELTRPYFLALLAEALGKVGQTEEGLTILAEALAAVHKTGECWCEAELYRIKGMLTLQSKVKTGLGQDSGKARQVQNKSKARRRQVRSLESGVGG